MPAAIKSPTAIASNTAVATRAAPNRRVVGHAPRAAPKREIGKNIAIEASGAVNSPVSSQAASKSLISFY